MALSMLSKQLNNPRDRSQDAVARLRFALDTLPNALHGLFNPPARARILAELYGALWGSNYSLFLAPNESLQPGVLLSEAQARSTLQPVDEQGPRACQHVFKKGECCFRCKQVSHPVHSISMNLTMSAEIVRWMTAALCVQSASTLQSILDMLSHFASPSSQEGAATVGIQKSGDIRSTVPTIIQTQITAHLAHPNPKTKSSFPLSHQPYATRCQK
jgi:hypothetical protein